MCVDAKHSYGNRCADFGLLNAGKDQLEACTLVHIGRRRVGKELI